jgi:hypothetical protein
MHWYVFSSGLDSESPPKLTVEQIIALIHEDSIGKNAQVMREGDQTQTWFKITNTEFATVFDEAKIRKAEVKAEAIIKKAEARAEAKSEKAEARAAKKQKQYSAMKTFLYIWRFISNHPILGPCFGFGVAMVIGVLIMCWDYNLTLGEFFRTIQNYDGLDGPICPILGGIFIWMTFWVWIEKGKLPGD